MNRFNYADELAAERKNREATQQQIKYYNHLVQLCEDNGIDTKLKRDVTSSDIAYMIQYLIKVLRKHKIKPANPYKAKYKLNKNGDVVCIKTRKVIKKHD